MKPKVIITIDTEIGEKAKFSEHGFDNFVMGKVNNEHYGVPKIVEILGSYGYKAEFFVDVYEFNYYGKKKYEKLCQYLRDEGHGVQLHTHPSYAYDVNRVNMHQYSLDEQIKIISDGMNMIKKWTGVQPIAHRAGGYGANNDTLRALKENNIKIDSSFYYKHSNCKIQLNITNEPVIFDNVLEIPVTVIKKNYSLLYIPIPFQHQWLKLDINLLSLEDLKSSLIKVKSKYIIIFLHSSSFILRDRTLLNIKGVNYEDLNKFEQLLYHIYENSYEVTVFSNMK